MAFITADFIKETTTSTGTGNVALAGARTPGSTFSSVCANGDTFHYAISHQTANEWEVGVGTYNSGANSISRSVLRSSNGGSLVNFSAGVKNVDLVFPRDRYDRLPGPISAGGNTFGSGTLVLSNANGVSFGLAGSVLTASVSGGGAAASVSLLQVTNVTNLTSFTGTSMPWSGVVNLPFLPTGSDSLFGLHNVSFRASSDSLFAGAFINVAALGFFGAAQQLQLQNSNNVSFGMAQTTVGGVPTVRATASATVAATRELGLISHSGGNSIGSASRLAFSDANGVSFSLSTAANAATLLGSINPAATRELGVVSHVGGNVVSSVSRLAFSNASNVTFSLSTAANAATLLGSVAASGFLGQVIHSDSTGGLVSSESSVSRLGFLDREGIVWSLFTGGGPGLVNVRPHVRLGVSAGVATNALSGVSFSNGSGVSWGIAGNVITASVSPPGAASLTVSAANGSFVETALSFSGNGRVSFFTTAGNQVLASAGIAVSAGTAFVFASNLGFADGSGVSFSYAGTQITASVGRELALVSHSGGNSVGTVRSVVFRDANNVSWSVSTAASGATVEASIAPNPTPLAVSAAGASASAGTVVWSNSNNVSFGQAGSTITASASFAAPAATRELGIVSHVGGNVVSSVSQLAFSNASNVTFSLSTAANAATLIASVAAGGGGGGVTYSGFLPYWGAAVIVTQSLTNNSFWVQPLNDAPAFQFDRIVQLYGLSNATNATNSNTLRQIVGIYTRNASTLSLVASTSFSTAFTGSGTAGSYSLFSGPRHLTVPWTSTLSGSNYWVGIGASLSTAGNSSYSVSFGMLSQSLGVPVYGFGLASNATYQSALGKGFLSATTTSPPGSIAFSQVNGSSSAAYRFPALYFGSGTA